MCVAVRSGGWVIIQCDHHDWHRRRPSWMAQSAARPRVAANPPAESATRKAMQGEKQQRTRSATAELEASAIEHATPRCARLNPRRLTPGSQDESAHSLVEKRQRLTQQQQQQWRLQQREHQQRGRRRQLCLLAPLAEDGTPPRQRAGAASFLRRAHRASIATQRSEPEPELEPELARARALARAQAPSA